MRRATRASIGAAAALAVLVSACSGSATPSATSASSSRHGSTIPGPSPDPSTSASAAAAPRTGRFTISFAGDVHFSGRIRTRLNRNVRTVFGKAEPGLRRADLTMVNLETAITTRGVPQAKEFHFRAPPKALTALRDAGIDVATEANNHGADYGNQGLHDTLRAIRRSHFPVIGIGKDADAAFRPFTRTVNGTEVAIIAADQVQDETTLRLFSAGRHKPGVANAYSPRLISAVKKAKAAGYLVIVYVHWGIELQTCPSGDQRALAKKLSRAGATAVIGTHAHVLQGAGWLPHSGAGTYVAYGLGNYLWWESFDNDQDDNGVLTLTFAHHKVVGSHFAASHLANSGVPVPAHGAQKRRIDHEFAADRRCTGLSATPPR
ncbi:CapA family protein [Jatrophihabitans endophyticus]|uniref:CapA family protein n=1 Tax=Jatrophihabitans endophyticus TaxID=1206085 RepID=UPI001A002DE3|nr:CapA family protein [Jatrophihabitans endophyticus]MBE7187218.1 CapA family protein [Jatrophihabitans endophyticus]